METMKSAAEHLLHSLFWIFLCISANTAELCPHPCTCQGYYNNTVNCSNLTLINPPMNSASTRTLDLSHNALGPILRSSFVQMRNLTFLDLSHNGLTRLLGCTFSGMLELRTVRLRGNDLTSLPDGLFADSTKLEHLDVGYNKFTEISNDLFRNLPELKSLDVAHNLIGQLKLADKFTVPTKIQTLDFSHNPIEALQSDSFEAASSWTTVSHRGINLASCRITSIETGAFSTFPNLNILHLSGNAIPPESLTIVMKDLESKQLERLSLAWMNLTTIEALFEEFTELSLTFLNVSFNSLTELPSNIFSKAKNLQELDLSRNSISTITNGFSDVVNINILNVSHNKLEAFHGDAVTHLSNLVVLDLSHNHLGESDSLNLSPLSNLKYLDVSNNYLSSVMMPGSTTYLQYLNYHSNRISEFDGIEDATKLEFVDFSNNNIQSLPGLLFKGAKFLKVVNFSRNNISNLDHGAFLPQSSIVIDLSHNLLKEIRFSNWVATQKLHIHHNELTNVDSQAFYGMTGLEELDLSFNKLMFLHEDLFQYLSRLNLLNLSNNHLDHINWFPLFRGLEHLVNLDLSHNSITHLNESMFLQLPLVKTVSLGNNHLRHINPGTFLYFKEITNLDLSDNPFDCSCENLPLRDWLRKTNLHVRGLFVANSTAYVCRSPRHRIGLHVAQWIPEEFECDKSMLYVIVFSSTFILLTAFVLIGAAIYRRYRKWKDRKEERRKILELEEENFRRNRKVDFVRLLNKNPGKDDKERPKKHEKAVYENSTEKRNGYISWPGRAKIQNESRTQRDVDYKRRINDENLARKEKERSGGHYEKLKREEQVDKEKGKSRVRGQEDRQRISRNEFASTERLVNRRESDNSYATFLHSDDRRDSSPFTISQHYEESARDARLGRDHERAFYSQRYQRTRPGPYIISSFNTVPNRWDNRRTWSGAQEFSNQEFSKPRGQGYRPGIYRALEVRGTEREMALQDGVGDNAFDSYPLEVHFDENREGKPYMRDDGEGPHHHNYYHQRSQSYTYLPEYVRNKELGQRRHQTRPHAGIGHRTASQPYLHNEGTSDWL